MVRYFKYLLILCILIVFPVYVVYAVQDQVLVNQTVLGADTSPPLPPTSVTATAISQTQIDLTWATSTDNVGATGYQVFRDSLQIATTTWTLYSDTGLTHSTLYAYTIAPFDAAGNIGLQSATTTETTLSPPPVVTVGSGNGPILLPPSPNPNIISLTVLPSHNSAIINWETNIATQGVISWGQTVDYAQGSLSEIFYGTKHSARIENLSPGTTYYFSITFYNIYNVQGQVSGQSFTTKILSGGVTSPNVTYFSVVPDERSIFLKWGNPSKDEIVGIRIVRKENGYPRDPLEGKVVFEGTGTQTTDFDTTEGITYYYTIFTRDKNGNYSSGAVGEGALLRGRETDKKDRSPTIQPVIESTDTGVDYFLRTLLFRDFDFKQSGRLINVDSDIVTIDAQKDLEISVPYEKVSEFYRTIIVGLQDLSGQERVYTFLLGTNDHQRRYEGIVSPFNEEGEYRIKISIRTKNNNELKAVEGTLVIKDLFTPPKTEISYGYIMLWVILLLLIIIILLILKKRKGVSENVNKISAGNYQ